MIRIDRVKINNKEIDYSTLVEALHDAIVALSATGHDDTVKLILNEYKIPVKK